MRGERVLAAALDARRLARLRRHQGAGAGQTFPAPNASRRRTSTSGTGRTPKCSRCRSCGSRRSGARRYPAVFNVGDEQVRTRSGRGDAQRHADARTASGRSAASTRPYRGEVQWGASRRPTTIASNTETGERTLIEKALTRTMGTSPDGKWFLYLEGQAGRRLQPRDGQDSTTLDDGEKISFVDDDGRPSVREADVRRGRMVEGRQVGAC